MWDIFKNKQIALNNTERTDAHDYAQDKQILTGYTKMKQLMKKTL